MTYLRDDIVQVYPPGSPTSAQGEPDSNHTPYFGVPPLLMMTTSLLRSFLSFKNLYGRMNLAWTLLFLASPSHCLIEVWSRSIWAQSSLVASTDICSMISFTFLSVFCFVCMHVCTCIWEAEVGIWNLPQCLPIS